VPDSSGGPLLKLFGAVAMIAAAGAALAHFARRRAIGRAGSAASIEVLAVRSLGPRHRVAVIETGGRRLLIGLASEHICPLLDLTEGAEFARALGSELPAANAIPEPPPMPLVSAIGRFEGLDA
jgi:flagellar biogenesis protein FliO